MVDKQLSVQEALASTKSFYNRNSLPPKKAFVSDKPTKVQESPLDARSPQEVLDYHGMYKDPSYYEQNPDRLYLDLTQFDDYETCANKLRDMKEKFDRLPIDVRARFNHNPEELFDYIRSDKFDIERVMDDKTSLAYKQFNARKEADVKMQEYLNSDSYKKVVAAQMAAQEEFLKAHTVPSSGQT